MGGGRQASLFFCSSWEQRVSFSFFLSLFSAAVKRVFGGWVALVEKEKTRTDNEKKENEIEEEERKNFFLLERSDERESSKSPVQAAVDGLRGFCGALGVTSERGGVSERGEGSNAASTFFFFARVFFFR